MMQIDEIRLLHRHGDDWHEMRPAHHSPAELDIERQLDKGGRVYECTSCDSQFRVVGVEGEEPGDED